VDIVLIPGFWLDSASWDEVAGPLRDAGHSVRALTLPGLESPDADRAGIGLGDHVAAVVRVVDDLPGPVVLVGHSGGGPIAYAVADARPDRIARVIYVDAGPLGPGQAINDGLPDVDGEIPLPDWSAFDDADLVDLDRAMRERFRTMARPEPSGVARDPQVLADERRHRVPATVIACQVSSGQLQDWMAQGVPMFAELARLTDLELVDLPTGHWPQFTRPADLASAILAAVTPDR
jgi:pimeloyl-ACP methyl ester carboxylesterase